MKRSIACFALVLAGCARAHTPFKPGQRISTENGYRQDGQLLGLKTLLDGLEQVPASREDAASARGWTTAGIVLVVPSGVGVGWGLGQGLAGKTASEREKGWIILGVGAAFTGLALGAGAVADAKLQRAVESYNATLDRPASEGAELLPWVGATADSRGSSLAVAGVDLRF